MLRTQFVFHLTKTLTQPQEGSHIKSSAHLLITVSNDGQIEELAPVLLRQDGVNPCNMRSGQLLVYCQIVRWRRREKLEFINAERKSVKHF